MYIRIQDKTIRYRVSREEAEQLINGETLFDCLDLNKQFNLSYSIVAVSRHSAFSFIAETNLMCLQVNKDELLNEIKDRPSKSGIEIENIDSTDENISIYLEIDIKKIKK